MKNSRFRFRAWNAGNNEWMKPEDVRIFIDGSMAFYENSPLPADKIHIYYPLISIMQFTGLYDCEKREIYEGDVVLVSNQMDYIQRAIIKGIVVNEWGSYGVKIIKVCQWEKYLVSPPEIEAILSFLNILNTRIIEVIGNVHENHELLT
jgi:uncharacterized phage protein (TIGR01671 family)